METVHCFCGYWIFVHVRALGLKEVMIHQCLVFLKPAGQLVVRKNLGLATRHAVKGDRKEKLNWLVVITQPLTFYTSRSMMNQRPRVIAHPKKKMN